MTNGKTAAQSGHAYTNTLLTAINQDKLQDYESIGKIGTKICLVAKNLLQLEKAHDKAQELGIPCSLITDEGHIMLPHFDGNPVITALGIGPITREQSKFLSKFKLLS